MRLYKVATEKMWEAAVADRRSDAGIYVTTDKPEKIFDEFSDVRSIEDLGEVKSI